MLDAGPEDWGRLGAPRGGQRKRWPQRAMATITVHPWRGVIGRVNANTTPASSSYSLGSTFFVWPSRTCPWFGRKSGQLQAATPLLTYIDIFISFAAMDGPARLPLQTSIDVLKAIAEPTRLRLLVLLAS